LGFLAQRKGWMTLWLKELMLAHLYDTAVELELEQYQAVGADLKPSLVLKRYLGELPFPARALPSSSPQRHREDQHCNR